MPFDRDKLMRSVQIALRKRPVDPERVERMVSGIVRRLENTGENDIQSEMIGRLVMEALKKLDDVAYVRFASVYKNFREAKDFEALLGELAGTEGERGRPADSRHAVRVAPRTSSNFDTSTLHGRASDEEPYGASVGACAARARHDLAQSIRRQRGGQRRLARSSAAAGRRRRPPACGGDRARIAPATAPRVRPSM